MGPGGLVGEVDPSTTVDSQIVWAMQLFALVMVRDHFDLRPCCNECIRESVASLHGARDQHALTVYA